ncbi:MAG: SPFH domain-containing protein [Planctomycetota bacterium]
MKADYLSYQRARGVSLVGLIIQTGLFVLLFVYSFYNRDHAGVTASFFIALGVPVWLCLVILYDQHRRERIEAIESEAMAAEASTSAFDQAGDEIRPAARRLKNLIKFALPAVALVLAATHIGVGVWRLTDATDLITHQELAEPGNRGWVISIGLGLAFVGFVFARFVSGMARQDIWQNLRAGAAYAVGSALLGLVLVVAHFTDLAGPSILVDWLPIVFPWVLLAIGAEIVLVFLFDLYRPRKPGEVASLTFESRLLGLVAASDRVVESIGEALNYQFGVDISSTWFYDLIRKIAPALIVVVLLVVWGLSSFVVLYPHQRGLLLRNGQLVKELDPGFHFKWPWPFDRVEIPEYRRVDPADPERAIITNTATGMRVLDLAGPPPFAASTAILWSEQHAQEEFYFICQPTSLEGERTDRSELALVAARIVLHYVVDEVTKFDELSLPEHRNELLRAVAQRELTIYLGSRDLEDIIADDRAAISGELQTRVAAAFGALDAGVDVRFVGLESAHPPQQVAPVFERVVQAEQARRSLILVAEADRIGTLSEVVGSVGLAERIAGELDEYYRLRDAGAAEERVAEGALAIEALLAEAGGEADAILQQARAERWDRHMGERGRAALHRGRIAAYEAAPRLFLADHYLAMLAHVLKDSRVYITSELIPDFRATLDLLDVDTRADLFAPESDEDF